MDDNVFAPGGEHSSNRGGGDVEAFVWTDRSLNDIMALLSRCWELVVANIGTVGIGIVIMFGLGMISQVVNFAVSLGTETISDPMTKIGVQMTAQYGAALFFFAIQLYFQLGLIKMVIELDRGNDVDLDMLWSQGGAWIQAIAVTIVLTFAYMVIFTLIGGLLGGLGFGAVAALGAESGFLAVMLLMLLAFAVLLPVFVILGLGLSVFMHALADERASYLGSLSFSWNLTDGWKLFLFLQSLVMLVLMLVVIVATCCMGAPVAQGILVCMQAVTYNAMLSDADENERFLG